MSVKYSYNITDTENNKVVGSKLKQEIDDSSITETCDYINTDSGSDTLDIYMSDTLSGEEETTLDGLVSNHDGVAESISSNFYSSSDDNESTTNTSWQQKLRRTQTVEARDYKISWYAELKSSDSDTTAKARVQIGDSTTLCEIGIIPDSGNLEGYDCFSGVYVSNLSAGSKNIDLDYCSSQSGKSVSIRRARILVEEI